MKVKLQTFQDNQPILFQEIFFERVRGLLRS